jgi:dihydroxyacid dehydratase/phosphogluconate dehydratase
MDGFVAIGGCDKNMPGAMIAHRAAEPPAVFVYGGTILPGCITGDSRKLDIRFRLSKPSAHARAARSATTNCTRGILRDSRTGFMRRHVYRQHHGQRD